MKFIKENIHDIIRLILNQVVMGVFGYVLFAAACMANEGEIGGLAIGASILSIFFYMYILYATLQETGAKHRVRVDGNRMKRDNFWGLKVMALSLIPTGVIMLVRIIGLLLYLASSEGVAAAGNLIFVITEFVFTFILSPYNGVIGFITGSSADTKTMIFVTVGYAVSVIPGLLVCWGSYIMGLHDTKLINLIIRKPSDNGDNS